MFWLRLLSASVYSGSLPAPLPAQRGPDHLCSFVSTIYTMALETLSDYGCWKHSPVQCLPEVATGTFCDIKRGGLNQKLRCKEGCAAFWCKLHFGQIRTSGWLQERQCNQGVALVYNVQIVHRVHNGRLHRFWIHRGKNNSSCQCTQPSHFSFLQDGLEETPARNPRKPVLVSAVSNY